MGLSERRELHSQVHRIIRHLLKLAFSPASPPRQGWIDSIDDARDMAARVLDASPSLRRELDAVITAEQPRGARAAIRDLGRYGELDPDISSAIRNVRYDAEQIFGDWFPPEIDPPPDPPLSVVRPRDHAGRSGGIDQCGAEKHSAFRQ